MLLSFAYSLPILIALGVLALALAGLVVWLYGKSNTDDRKVRRFKEEADSKERIIQKANDAVFVIDTVNGNILDHNEKAAVILDYSSEELTRKSIFDLHPKEMMQRSSERIADVWEQKGMVYEDLPMVTKDGTELPVECSAKTIPYLDRPAILIYARDIRLRKAMQEEIQRQSDEIKHKNEDLTDSIVYARRIQRSILPLDANVKASFKDVFVFYRPKDIVSGDFYWHAKVKDTHFLAAVDCTGHGVPGAFMSMLGSSLLKQIVETEHILEPGKILEQLHIEVRSALKQGEESGQKSEDGMDLSLIAWHPSEKKVQFAGAYNSLVYMHKQLDGAYEEEVFKADRYSIGGSSDEQRTFTQYDIQCDTDDMLYLYSDGYPDQFGGKRGKKFMDKKLRRMLASIAGQSVADQEQHLEQTINEWRGDRPQLDDILVIGFRIP